MKDKVQQADARIEQALRGLREAEPAGTSPSSTNFEQRVIAAVRERTAQTPPRRSWLIVFAVSRWWLLTAAAVAVLAAMLWAGHAHVVRQGAIAPVARVLPAPPPTPALPSAEIAHGPNSFPGQVRVRTRLARTTGLQHGKPIATVALGNHPAPEAPLTAEERLLLRLAHRGRPEEYAVLNPDARDRMARTETKQFQEFFEPTTTRKERQ